MKTTEVKFEVISGENGSVTIKYTCLYRNPKLPEIIAEVTLPGTHQVFQVGMVRCPEWTETGHIFIRGSETEHDNDVIERKFETEGLARNALWQALYGLRDFEVRALRHKHVPKTSEDHITTIVVNGKEFRLTDPELDKFMAILR